MAGNLKGIYVAEALGGFVLVWSGIKNQTLKGTLTDLLKGQNPPKVSETAPSIGVASSGSSGSSSTSASNPSGSSGGTPSVNQGIARMLAAANGHPGWATGSEWTDWVNLWNRESGWSQNARNASSGAYGIAQSLGHGGSGTAASDGTNEYGAQYGLSEAQARAANGGNASDQILWGIGYIAATYGSPSAAWAHEESAGWY